MENIFYYLNLIVSVICIILCLFIFLSYVYLKLPRFFLYLGYFLFFTSLGSLTNALLSSRHFQDLFRELYLLFHIFGLCSIFPFVKILAGLNPSFRNEYLINSIYVPVSILIGVITPINIETGT